MARKIRMTSSLAGPDFAWSPDQELDVGDVNSATTVTEEMAIALCTDPPDEPRAEPIGWDPGNPEAAEEPPPEPPEPPAPPSEQSDPAEPEKKEGEVAEDDKPDATAREQATAPEQETRETAVQPRKRTRPKPPPEQPPADPE